MANGEKTPTESAVTWLVPRARRPIPVAPVLVVPLFGAIYFLAAMINPFIGGSPFSVLILSLLAMLTVGYAILAPNGDILDPMRLVSVYFAIAFCVGPLAADGIYWHYTRPFHELLLGPTVYCFFAFVMILAGYHFPTFAPIPKRISRRSGANDPGTVMLLGGAFWLVGFVGWVGLVVAAGGVRELVFSDKGRSEFFYGVGILFWFAIFMFPGALMYWSSRLEMARGKLPIAHAWIVLVTFVSFFLLQGRMRAINVLILGLFVAHYLYRPLKPVRLAIFGAAGLFMALVVGVARAPSMRGFAFTRPTAFLVDVIVNIDELLRGVLLGDLSRLRQIVLIMDKVPAWMPYDWGRSLFHWTNPWLRLFGFPELTTAGVGPRLFQLAHPSFPDIATGYLPSILGEMIVNFPWFIAIFAFLPFGMFLRAIYNGLIVKRGDFLAVALYAALLLQAANMILQSFGHVIFELFLVTMPFFIVRFVARRSGSVRHPPDAAPNRSASTA